MVRAALAGSAARPKAVSFPWTSWLLAPWCSSPCANTGPATIRATMTTANCLCIASSGFEMRKNGAVRCAGDTKLGLAGERRSVRRIELQTGRLRLAQHVGRGCRSELQGGYL